MEPKTSPVCRGEASDNTKKTMFLVHELGGEEFFSVAFVLVRLPRTLVSKYFVR